MQQQCRRRSAPLISDTTDLLGRSGWWWASSHGYGEGKRGGWGNLPTFLKECSASALPCMMLTRGLKAVCSSINSIKKKRCGRVWLGCEHWEAPTSSSSLQLFIVFLPARQFPPPPLPLFYTTHCSGNCPPTQAFLLIERKLLSFLIYYILLNYFISRSIYNISAIMLRACIKTQTD